MKYNINHKNYFQEEKVSLEELVVKPKKEPEIENKKEEVVEEEKEIEVPTEGYLKSLNNVEQEEILTKLGLDKYEIKKLKFEKDRISKILELYS